MFQAMDQDQILGLPLEELREPVGLESVFIFGLANLLDEPTAIRFRERPLPLTYFAACILAPLAIGAWKILDDAGNNLLQVPPYIIVVFIGGSGSMAVFYWLIVQMNRELLAKGPYFIIDKERRTLSLPRQPIELLPSQVRAIVEVRGWCNNDENNNARYHHLSVLAENASQLVTRHPIAADTCPWARFSRVRKPAILLEDFFRVPRYVIENPKDRVFQLKAEGIHVQPRRQR